MGCNFLGLTEEYWGSFRQDPAKAEKSGQCGISHETAAVSSEVNSKN